MIEGREEAEAEDGEFCLFVLKMGHERGGFGLHVGGGIGEEG